MKFLLAFDIIWSGRGDYNRCRGVEDTTEKNYMEWEALVEQRLLLHPAQYCAPVGSGTYVLLEHTWGSKQASFGKFHL